MPSIPISKEKIMAYAQWSAITIKPLNTADLGEARKMHTTIKKIILALSFFIVVTGNTLADIHRKHLFDPKICEEDKERAAYTCGSGDPFACWEAKHFEKIDHCPPY